jgi:hypothetical protein
VAKLILFAAAAYLVYRLYQSGGLGRRPRRPAAPDQPPRPEPRFRPDQVVDADFSEVDDDRTRRP